MEIFTLRCLQCPIECLYESFTLCIIDKPRFFANATNDCLPGNIGVNNEVFNNEIDSISKPLETSITYVGRERLDCTRRWSVRFSRGKLIFPTPAGKNGRESARDKNARQKIIITCASDSSTWFFFLIRLTRRITVLFPDAVSFSDIGNQIRLPGEWGNRIKFRIFIVSEIFRVLFSTE